jgi:hypothetical protein
MADRGGLSHRATDFDGPHLHFTEDHRQSGSGRVATAGNHHDVIGSDPIGRVEDILLPTHVSLETDVKIYLHPTHRVTPGLMIY